MKKANIGKKKQKQRKRLGSTFEQKMLTLYPLEYERENTN